MGGSIGYDIAHPRVPCATVPDAFYLPDGDRFVSTEATQGPWSPGEQHGGPPSALLSRALERCEPRDGFRIARITIEIMRAVPLDTLTATAYVARPGRSVELLEGSLATDTHEVMRARAWRIRTGESQPTDDEAEPPPGPEMGEATEFFWAGEGPGYGRSMDWLFVRGGLAIPGPSSAWMRMRVPLVAGEEPTPLQRVMIAADSGNGISAVADPREWLFINTDLTVTLARHPVGEHVNLDARTHIGSDGIGLTETILRDTKGRIGHATQTLLVRRRG